MSDNPPSPHPPNDPGALLRWVQSRTPARLLVGRAGPAYRTATQLELRRDHAAAADAVRAELDLEADLGRELVESQHLFEVRSHARDKSEYLLRPDLGRRLDPMGAAEVKRCCPTHADLQIVIGDGLSVAAVRRQVPVLLPLLIDGARERGWSAGQTFVIRHCRVGIVNEIGDLLQPVVVALLIGERPGLATAESLSAYLAHRPRAGDSDARRNLISNIHERGVPLEQAAQRILRLAEKMRQMGKSGVEVKEELEIEKRPLRHWQP
jgi:ethanolamine ammonia-lyase small subunit